MASGDYQEWESGASASLHDIQAGIAALQQSLVNVRERLQQSRTLLVAVATRSTQTEGSGGILTQSHANLRESLAYAVARGRTIEAVLAAAVLDTMAAESQQFQNVPDID